MIVQYDRQSVGNLIWAQNSPVGQRRFQTVGGKAFTPTSSPSPLVYRILYNGNGNTSGSAPEDANEYEEGATATVLGSGTLAKTNYTWERWNTTASGTGTNYAPDDSLTVGTADTTLYAQWGDYTVTSLSLGDVGFQDSLYMDPIALDAGEGALFSCWTKVPTQAGEYPKHRGNNTYLVVNGGVNVTDAWSLAVVALNCDIPEEGSSACILNTNTMMWGCGQLYANGDIPSGWYFGDFTFYNDNEYTEDECWGWIWSAVQVVRTESGFTLRQWFKVQGRDVYENPVSTFTVAEARTALINEGRDAEVVNAWTPSSTITGFTLGKLPGEEPYGHTFVTLAKVHTGTDAPSTATLEAIAARTAPDATAWGDWPLLWTSEAVITDRSGNERDLSVMAGGTVASGVIFTTKKQRVIYTTGTEASGDPPTDSNEYDIGDTATILGQGTVSYLDWIFAGWTDSVDTYQEGDSITLSYSNAVLTPVFNAPPRPSPP